MESMSNWNVAEFGNDIQRDIDNELEQRVVVAAK